MTSEFSEFIIFLEPARAAMVDQPTAEETAAVEAHFQYLSALTEQGTVILAGRTTQSPPIGIVLLRADGQEEAMSIMNGDPAVAAGVFRARLSPFRIALLQSQA